MKPIESCAGGKFEPAGARFGVFWTDTASPLKKSLQAAERQRADVARARRRWIREQGMLDPARLVFIDETAVSTNLVRLRGRAPRGVRLIGYVPLGEWKTVTFVAALRHNKMVAPMVVEGAGVTLRMPRRCRSSWSATYTHPMLIRTPRAQADVTSVEAANRRVLKGTSASSR